MIPRRIPTRQECQEDPLWFVAWGISPELAMRLMVVADQADPMVVNIISGFRTAEHERDLVGGIAPELSTHTTCPATGADLSLPTVTPTDAVKAQFGSWVTYAGLRWGGGSTINQETGIPRDWNHVDLGPRTDSVAQAYRNTL